MHKQVLKILLVDDDMELLNSLCEHLGEQAGLEIVGTVTDGIQALKIVESNPVDVVISDLRMPAMDGLQLFAKLQTLSNRPRFVAMTAHDRDEAMLELLRSGAHGYIIKGDSPSEIRRSIFAAAEGGTVISPNALTRLLKHVSQATARPTGPDTSGLSPNTARVLDLVCTGRSNSKISEVLGMSVPSVKKQVSYLLTYFGVSSRSELIVLMHRS